MWLKVVYNEDDIPKWANKLKDIYVSIESGEIAPIDTDFKSFRISPIFPLIEGSLAPPIENTEICFFSFNNAYRVLGKINNEASKDLKECIYFSNGLPSIMLISSNKSHLKNFQKIVDEKERAFEKWIIKGSKIISIKSHVNKQYDPEYENLSVVDYASLPLTERALIDEFAVGVKFLLIKLTSHMPLELPKIKKLIGKVNVLINSMVFLSRFEGKKPKMFSEFTLEDLQNRSLNNILKNQILDRIIQINSSLTYVSTQGFSGAVPILERRSLIRRNSLLGVGSTILALNNFARLIENSFSKVAIEKIIIKIMSVATQLKGLEIPYYDSQDWYKSSITEFDDKYISENVYFKLPYFNGRLGFRETEYSIAAAIQSISSGASLKWSLMTLTHEMLHGHVRNIITSIFYGNDQVNRQNQRHEFYERFVLKFDKKLDDEKLIDSIRSIIFTYCCFSYTHGSLTLETEPLNNKFKFILLEENTLWNVFEHENRNIHELFVHVLDLHYFYASRITVYIPLIWASWVAVPSVAGDLRQYILRSILAIASKTDGTTPERFADAAGTLGSLLNKYKSTKLNNPVIYDVIDILENPEILRKYYFPAFKSSIIIVDMVTNIFISSRIRTAIFNDDDFVVMRSNEESENDIEDAFLYNLPDGFNDVEIKSPVFYLLAKMNKELNSLTESNNIERDTALQFLAMNSYQ